MKRHSEEAKQRKSVEGRGKPTKMSAPGSGGPREQIEHEHTIKIVHGWGALDDVIRVPVSYSQIHALTPWASLIVQILRL